MKHKSPKKRSVFSLHNPYFVGLAALFIVAGSVGTFAKIGFATQTPPTIVVNTISGQNSPFTFNCATNPLFNPVTISGSGAGSGNISQYNVQIVWGDGITENAVSSTFTPSSGNVPFTFTFHAGPHTYATSTSPTITARVYHGQPPGKDGEADSVVSVPLCVHVPPSTKGSVQVVKVVSGGSAQVSDFSLSVGTAHVTSGAANDFLPATYAIIESGGPLGYAGVFSGDCDTTGHVTVAAGSHYTCTLTNTFSSAPVNHPPFAVADSYSTNEDTALAVSAPGVLGNDTDADHNTLTAVLVTNASHGTVLLSTNGAFTYTPAANYNGPDSFTYKANDGSADSATTTVSLTVNSINDVPSFTKGSDQSVDEDAGAQTVSGWATALSAGPANESTQTLSFIVSNNNNALFSAQPTVAADGTLSYT